MKLSGEIASFAHLIGEERTIDTMGRVGFDAWDFSMFSMGYCGSPLSGENYVQFAKKLRRAGENAGISCNQSHAPFPVYHYGTRSYLARAIECTAIAGGRICVIHPANHEPAEKNREMFLELLPLAKEYGIKLATENMWKWDPVADEARPCACSTPADFLAHLDAVNDGDFVACLDLGHAEMRGLGTSAEEMILALGDRLQALHIHDNDLHHDSHQIPFSMQMDFGRIIRALKQIGYRGDFTLEADRYYQAFTADTAAEGIGNLAEAGRKLIAMYEEA